MQYFAAAWRLALTSALVCFPHVAPADESRNFLFNAGAELPADADNLPPGWFDAIERAPELRLFIDTGHSRAGNACLAVSNQHQYDREVSNNWGQEVRSIPVGKTVRLSGYIRTDEAESANICVQCWNEGATRLIGFASTPVFRGTRGWTLAEAPELVVPPDTKKMLVRAALTGKGTAYFDDVSLEAVDVGTAARSDAAAGDAGASKAAGRNRAVIDGATSDVAPPVAGQIVRRLPLVKDTMILAYLPRWNHGNVDNIGVANNGGGVQTLLAWEPPSPAEIAQSDLRFVLAMYSRNTTLHGKSAPIEVRELLGDWDETTSWDKRPQSAAEPAAEFEMQPGEGWKVFDVTALVRKQAVAADANHGVVLRCPDPGDKEKSEWSGYMLVSREAIGKLESRRPVLLVVRP
jgi:hypothetical protein